MLGFLEKLTLHPEAVGPADMVPLREAGLTDEEIADAIHVCAAFNVINRASDALGFELQEKAGYHRYAATLLMIGYK